jgi:hypothetical protein
MKTTKKRLLLLLIALLLLAGCSHHYIPRTTTFDFEEIDEFLSNSTVSLINDQPFSDDVLFLSRGTHDYYADFKAWTEKAIAITQREITSRGMKVVEDAPKFLKLSVMTAEGTTGMWQVYCETSLRVETGDGYVNEYVAKAGSPASLQRAVDGAVMRVVAAMLRDRNIIRYLQAK